MRVKLEHTILFTPMKFIDNTSLCRYKLSVTPLAGVVSTVRGTGEKMDSWNCSVSGEGVGYMYIYPKYIQPGTEDLCTPLLVNYILIKLK